MDKKHFASLMEDHSPGPSTDALRPLSPFRNRRRSGTHGEDEANTYGTSSHTGLGPDLDLGQDHQAELSCVTKETSLEDCARHRFIVWAAVKRNSSVRMTPRERLECPLLRCTQQFADHETMLKHLAGCRHLASGEYWCYDHMRVERFDDLKCKRCLGHPSKRRKILGMAKNFFHSLGHKSKKAHGLGLDDDEPMLPPPPSYDSLDIPDDLVGNASELPSTEILEIDSVEVPAIHPTPVPAHSDAIDPQALLMPMVPALPELDSTMLANETFMQWQPVPDLMTPLFPVVQQEEDAMRNFAVKPTLQLTTFGLQGRRQAPRPVARPAPVLPRNKGLSPSSSVRSTASTDTNATTTSNGSSLVSPASNWSGAWSRASGLNTNMTSPVDGIMADEMFADAMDYNACPDYLHDFFSELPADLPPSKDVCDLASDAYLGFEAPLAANMSYAPAIILTEEAAELASTDERVVEEANVCCSETKSLVSAAWDALQEHIVSSMVKIQDHRENYLAKQLGSMSIRTVATTGLRTLRALVNGHQPSSASDALCLIHLVYAFSLVLHEQETSHRFSNLFLQSLTYASGLPSNERDSYRHLVTSIWQPPDLTQADVSNHFAAVSRTSALAPNPKGKSPEVFGTGVGQHSNDPLLVAARDFLDELEISLVLGQDSLPLDVQVSDLHITHLKDMNPTGLMNGALLATAQSVLEVISRGFGDAGALNSRLGDIYQRLSNGGICSIRRIEIELLHAGRDHLPSTRFFGDFVPQVRGLCDQVYEHHDVGRSRRDVYHSFGIALIESLVPEFDNPAKADDIDALFNDLVSEAGDATSMTFTETFDLDDNEAQLPTPTATAGGTPCSAQATSPAREQAQHPTPAEASEQQQLGPKVEADSCCDICGYRPKGDPQWFKGSMAKHRKLQHSAAPPKIFKCSYPGCTSQYKNRPDNLRQHQIEKNHFVQGEESTPRRPSKRKKVATEED